MSSFELEGKLHVKGETQKVTESFTKREIVIEVEDGPYTQYIKMEFLQDRCSEVDKFNEGDKVKVGFNLRGREYNGRYFTNLNAWRIEKAALTGLAEAIENSEQRSEYNVKENKDDLPF